HVRHAELILQTQPFLHRSSQNSSVSMKMPAGRNIGNAGGPISANGPGVPSAKTTARTEPPGNRFLTTKLGRAPIAGMRTDWPEFPIVTNISASLSPSGTDEIPF